MSYCWLIVILIGAFCFLFPLCSCSCCIKVWNVALDLFIAFLLSLICFWKALRGVFFAGVPPTLAHLFPLSLFLYVSYRAVTPWKDRRDLYEVIFVEHSICVCLRVKVIALAREQRSFLGTFLYS